MVIMNQRLKEQVIAMTTCDWKNCIHNTSGYCNLEARHLCNINLDQLTFMKEDQLEKLDMLGLESMLICRDYTIK